MPKVYEQQISLQPSGSSRVQYDKLQDFITPALENANRATQNAMAALQQIGDKRAASALDQAARDAANDIDNWTDFKDPATTQDKMVASAMEKYDKVMADMDPATRNRINLYNPKSRDIFEVKAKEKAADVSYQYAYRNALANMDKDVGNLINEGHPQDPYAVKSAVDAHLETMKQVMRPADFLNYSKEFKSTAEKGLVEWYLAHGMTKKALDSAKNDDITGDVNESTRANWVRMAEKALSDGSSGSKKSDGEGQNLADVLVTDMHQPMDVSFATMARMTSSIEHNTALSPEDYQYMNLPLVDGKSYVELLSMPRTQAIDLIRKNANTVSEGIEAQELVRSEFVPLMTEWMSDNISEEVGSGSDKKRQLKKGADISQLKLLYQDFKNKGFDRLLTAIPSNSDLKGAFYEIMDALNAEKVAQTAAFGHVGENISYFTNNPTVAGFFAAPATKEEAAEFNTPEQMQQSAALAGGMSMAAGFDRLDSTLPTWDKMGNIEPEMSPITTVGSDGEAEAYNTVEKQQQLLNKRRPVTSIIDSLDQALKDGNITQDEYNKFVSSYKSVMGAQFEGPFKRAEAEETTSAYEQMKSDLEKEFYSGRISQQRYNELNRYLYELSEGKASKTYPCLVPNSKIPIGVWNQCMAAHGFGTVKNTARYDREMDKGLHDLSYSLREATKTKFDSGTVGDVYQVLLAYIGMALRFPGNSESFGMPESYVGMFTDDTMTEIYNSLEAKRAATGELNNLVDLTNHSSLYTGRNGDYEGKSWDPANPSKETTTDITQSKQYELIGDIENEFSIRAGVPIKFTDEMKRQMAMYIRQMSSGYRESVRSNISKGTKQDLANEKMQNAIKNLIGEQDDK